MNPFDKIGSVGECSQCKEDKNIALILPEHDIQLCFDCAEKHFYDYLDKFIIIKEEK